MSVVLTLFLSGATPGADHSITAESFSTMQACEAEAGRSRSAAEAGFFPSVRDAGAIRFYYANFALRSVS